MKKPAKPTGRKLIPDDDDCPVRDVLAHLTSKWPMLILFALMEGPHRFLELQRRIENISKRMLTVSLRKLELDGYVQRTVYPESPPRVEYALTPLGESVTHPLINLIGWAQDHHDEIRQARTDFSEKVSNQG
ncbi:MAG: helix-turn-helix transcriptional regulator [Pseudomonadales bacterium]|nr:helix-turn-helix transcriptional regulator [Pseudomonadales bacterium]